MLTSTQAWMGAAETIWGQLAVAKGLVRYQATNPSTPFASVVPHVASALEAHARVQAHHTPARVAAAATEPSFRMPPEPSSPRAGNQRGDSN